ncbi:MAG: hypothetical protein V4543_00705 [Bacteroidota bacterium]
MADFKKAYRLEVKVKDDIDGEKKMKAVASIIDNLTTQQLVSLAEVVTNPIKMAIAKSKLGF